MDTLQERTTVRHAPAPAAAAQLMANVATTLSLAQAAGVEPFKVEIFMEDVGAFCVDNDLIGRVDGPGSAFKLSFATSAASIESYQKLERILPYLQKQHPLTVQASAWFQVACMTQGLKKVINDVRNIAANDNAFTVDDMRPSRYISNCWIRVTTESEDSLAIRLTHLARESEASTGRDTPRLDSVNGDYRQSTLSYPTLRGIVDPWLRSHRLSPRQIDLFPSTIQDAWNSMEPVRDSFRLQTLVRSFIDRTDTDSHVLELRAEDRISYNPSIGNMGKRGLAYGVGSKGELFGNPNKRVRSV
ncbi:hypothetical protein KC354_g6064 [Hortaea werneckii]|nr:hypothetical protein KC354_g6064 [Hortaea werneckii]